MDEQRWQKIVIPPGNEDHVWELFHENSKIGRYSDSLSDEQVLARMQQFHESLPFVGYPTVDLPRSFTPMRLSLEEAMTKRVSARSLKPCSLALQDVATLLHYGYGVTRDNKNTGFPRPFRVVPSAGALYPLEIFFHSARIEDLKAGLYHYNPTTHYLRLLREQDETQKISEALVQPDIAFGASLLVFITAVFDRTIFKYGDRGYRFTMLEAGHLAQNMGLVANGLGLGCVNIGGYFDREIDAFLGLDGLTHSTIYIIAIGARTIDEHSSQ